MGVGLRTSLLLLLLCCMGATYVIENPASTLMFDFPVLRKTLVKLKRVAGIPVPRLIPRLFDNMPRSCQESGLVYL